MGRDVKHPFPESVHPQSTERPALGRRSFLTRLAAGGGLALGLPSVVHANTLTARRQMALNIRIDAATLASQRPQPTHPSNGEETLYANKIASYSKGLPHDALGEVDLNAYAALKLALKTMDPYDFEQIPLGSTERLVDPQAAFAFDLEGADSHDLAIPPAPRIAGAEAASELVELYWMALARDVAFSDYQCDQTIFDAAAELSTYAAFRGPRNGGVVTPDTIFRGATAGDLIGPYVSQFLWMDIPMGALLVPQRIQTFVPNLDYMTDYWEWLGIQNGDTPGPPTVDPDPRYIRNLRDLAAWVRMDGAYQAYLQACLILLGMQAPFDAGIYYTTSVTQVGWGTFGGPHIVTLLAEVVTRALKAVWYQKWSVHRRLRPEAFGGLVHNTLTGVATYPFNRKILTADAVNRMLAAHGTYLLPSAYPEGSPLHPSYGAGHATVAGACVTILKAWFDEDFVLPDTVMSDSDGMTLVPYCGPDLTVGNELNKLAANIAIGRNAAGIHYRSDYFQSILLGEAIALTVLEEQRATYNEPVSFTLTKFDGTPVTT